MNTLNMDAHYARQVEEQQEERTMDRDTVGFIEGQIERIQQQMAERARTKAGDPLLPKVQAHDAETIRMLTERRNSIRNWERGR